MVQVLFTSHNYNSFAEDGALKGLSEVVQLRDCWDTKTPRFDTWWLLGSIVFEIGISIGIKSHELQKQCSSAQAAELRQIFDTCGCADGVLKSGSEWKQVEVPKSEHLNSCVSKLIHGFWFMKWIRKCVAEDLTDVRCLMKLAALGCRYRGFGA